jgi:cbb3-type cytochrome oxidase subunit 3
VCVLLPGCIWIGSRCVELLCVGRIPITITSSGDRPCGPECVEAENKTCQDKCNNGDYYEDKNENSKTYGSCIRMIEKKSRENNISYWWIYLLVFLFILILIFIIIFFIIFNKRKKKKKKEKEKEEKEGIKNEPSKEVSVDREITEKNVGGFSTVMFDNSDELDGHVVIDEEIEEPQR